MKKIFFSLFCAMAAIVCAVSCRMAELETDEVNLSQLLRPVEVSAVSISSESIRVSWRGKADTFELEYSTVADMSADIETVADIEENEYLAAGLEEGVTYYFRVRGISADGSVESSEYSDIAYARTPVEPLIPNVRAESSMEYTTDPWSVTCTVVLAWGDPSLDPEAVSSVVFTPTAGGEPLTFEISSEAAAAQTVTLSEGIQTGTEYNIDLMVGDRRRGNVVHTTVPGPIPSLDAEAVLNFDTVPVSADVDFTWSLYYVPAGDIASIVISTDGSDDRTVEVTDDDKTAGHLTVTDLKPGTAYSAVLKDNDGGEVASVTFTTPEAPSEEMLVVRPEDDLMAVLSDPDRSDEVIYLAPGEHVLDFEDVEIHLTRGLELISDSPANTTLRLDGGCIAGEGDIDRIVFRNLNIVCSTYLVQMKSVYNIGLYHIDGCIVDLNSAATGNSTLFNTSSDTGSVLADFRVSNSLVYANIGQTQYIVFQAASGSSANLRKLTLENSTFASCARGLVYTACTNDLPCDVSIDHCTMYDIISQGGSQALLNIRYNGTENAGKRSVSLTNSVIYGANDAFRLLHFGSATAVGSVSADNFWYFSSQTLSYGSSGYNINDRLTSYSDTPARLWENPMDNPADPAASFRIKDDNVRFTLESSGLTLGDQRWEE